MKISRQKIYQTFFWRSFFRSFSLKYVAQSKLKLIYFFKHKFGFEPIFLGRARMGISLAVSYAISKNKKTVCLMSPLTIIDLVNMVENAGASAEFYDFKKNNLEIDFYALKSRIMKGDISCLVITHYYFIDKNIQDIVKLCKKYNITLIEDCAISLGASYREKNAGTFGDISVFSFSIFKFLNFFWGGAIISKDPNAIIFFNAQIATFRNLSIFDYLPQFLKFSKYGFVTHRWVYFFIFYFFSYGLKNNIRFIKNNIQNDPFVPRFQITEPSCLTQPNKIFYVELADKISSVFSQLEDRRLKAFFIYSNINKKYCLQMEHEIFLNGSFINFPLIFKNKKIRDNFALLLLNSGIDVSTQLYRNVHQVDGYTSIAGKSSNISNIGDRLLFLPIHRSVSFDDIVKIVKIINNISSSI
jgi:dTDP-4-amino-4,6-dideoxygalactose transaminase